jgi:ribosomal protein S18 acetylase RimI-like enzyme
MHAVRPAQPADIPAVIRLTELWAMEPSTTGHYPVNFAEDLRRRLGPYFWVAEDAAQVVGFIIGTLNGDTARSLHYQVLRKGEDHLSLDQLYVHPDHRRQGVGSQLVAHLFQEASSRGIHRHLVMSANTDWQRTMRFYEKHGFRMWYFRMFTGYSTEERPEDTDGETSLRS